MKQKEKVMKYMKQHGGITSMDAFPMGITRLSGVIFRLKQDGVSIKSKDVVYKNKDGETKHFSEYYLDGVVE